MTILKSPLLKRKPLLLTVLMKWMWYSHIAL
ncbi:Uncharacterised protein [Vibrio cholerae]|nr:Uncharacterised protein [Vibrio cholerae]